MSAPSPATMRGIMRHKIEDKCRSGEELDAAEIGAIRQDPGMLTDTAGGYSVIAAAGTSRSSTAIRQMSAEGLITPEMLAKGSGCWTGVNYEGSPREVSNFELLLIRGKESSLDPAVYRKALAMSLRKEESVGNRRQWTSDRLNTLLQVKWNSDEHGWGESGLAEIEADPELVLGPVPAHGLLYHALVLAGQDKPEPLKQLNPYVTPEMLVVEVKDNFYADLLSRAVAGGTDKYFDPKVIRQAVAMKHRREESLTEAVLDSFEWEEFIERLVELAYSDEQMTSDDVEAIRDNPDILTTPEVGLGVVLVFIATRSSLNSRRSLLLQQLTDHGLITADMLLKPGRHAALAGESSTILDTIVHYGVVHMLDPKIVRQATAMKLAKSESLARRVISQLV